MANAFYIYTPSFQQVFIDKDTQAPMSGGFVYFYEDNNRSALKTIYQLSGAPGSYQYVPAANPQTLNMAGAFDQAIYLFPFDADENVDLYYVSVFNANMVPQFQRQAQPTLEPSAVLDSPLKTYAINGQFTSNIPVGNITGPATLVAPGNWSFIRPALSTATDNVTFDRFSSFVINPNSNPRYAARIKCTVANPGDTIKALRLKFPNVNFLASSINPVTVAFSAISNSGAFLNNVGLYLVKNFGTGGSATEEIALTNFNFSTSYQQFSYTFVPGDNDNLNVGSQDDDYLAIDLRFPPGSTYDVSITDYMVLPGEVDLPIYPQDNWNLIYTQPKTGDMKMITGPYVEQGWVLGNGQELNRTTYSDLFSLYNFVLSGTTSTSNTFIQNGTTVNGMPTITALTDTTDMYIGMSLTSANFSGAVNILSVDSSTQVTVSANATASSTVPTTFTTARQITGISSTANLYIGMQLTGANFPSVATIINIDSSSQITVDTNATASSTIPLTFYAYGAGDGTSTFNVPNVCSRMPIGNGQGAGLNNYVLGQTGGAEFTTQTIDTLVAHSHRPTDNGGFTYYGGFGGPNGFQGPNSGISTTSRTEIVGGGQPMQTISPYLTLNFIIKT